MKESQTKGFKSSTMALLSAAVVSSFLIPAAESIAATAVQPDVRVGPSYIDVEQADTGDGVTDFGWQLDVRVRLSVFDEQGEVYFVPVYRRSHYSDQPSLERETERLTVGWDRTLETGNWSLRADYSRQDLFTSEFEDAISDPEQDDGFDGNDSGLVGEGTRDKLRVSASLEKMFSRRAGVVLNANYLDTSYDVDAGTGRVDFDQLLASAGLRFRLSERTSLIVLGGGRRYRADDGLDVDSVGGDVRVENQLSETTSFHAGVGYEELEATQPGVEPVDETTIPVRIGLSRRTEVAHLALEAEHFAWPISTGEFRQRTRLTARWRQNMSERFTIEFGLAANRDENFDSAANDTNRDFVSGKLDLAWALGRRWSVGLEYYSNRQDFDGADAPIGFVESRNELFLSFRYLGLDRRRPDEAER